MPGDSRRHLIVPLVLAVVGLLLAAGVAGAYLVADGEPSQTSSGVPTHRPTAATSAPHTVSNPAPDSTLGWSGTSAASSSAPCGTAGGAPARVAHVIVIVLENHSYAQLIGPPGSPAAGQAPFLNSIARHCGMATQYHSVTHPSLPNYLAITGGSTHGLARDTNTQVPGPSIFSALDAVHGSWAVYAEDMPGPCWTKRTSATGYTPHHNPVVSYAGLTADCQTHDLPLGTPSAGRLADALRTQTLPSYSLIAPSLGHDMHTGSVGAGDRWLSQWIAAIVHSPTYRDQSTAIFITADEGSGGHIGKGESCPAHPYDQSCHVPLIVISRYVKPGTRVATPADHYALLRTTAGLLGVAAPGEGAHAVSLRQPFGL
ncbi:MAG: alkaline phosphatase family protein [Gaiellales bacterium]